MSSREIKVQSDAEILGAALEEAQRLIAAYQNPNPGRSRDDILAMLEFIICDPVVIRAMLRQKMRSRLKLVV